MAESKTAQNTAPTPVGQQPTDELLGLFHDIREHRDRLRRLDEAKLSLPMVRQELVDTVMSLQEDAVAFILTVRNWQAETMMDLVGRIEELEGLADDFASGGLDEEERTVLVQALTGANELVVTVLGNSKLPKNVRDLSQSLKEPLDKALGIMKSLEDTDEEKLADKEEKSE